MSTFSQKTARTVAVVVFMGSPVAIPAFAIDLASARASGSIGEMDNGFIALPPGAGKEGEVLAESINAQRKAEYANVAEQNKITQDAVGRMMFEKIYKRLPVGTWVKIQDKWSRKQ
ncbi:MAG: YdbL family protein [Chlorobiaceae bacterium]|nr:YdbL family protein [Chlorobiaceae bacterium]